MTDIEDNSDIVVIRATPDELTLLRRAADATSKTLSDFLLDAGVEAAEKLLVDRRVFRLDDAQWKTFHDVLNRSVRRKTRLKRLLSEPDRQKQ